MTKERKSKDSGKDNKTKSNQENMLDMLLNQCDIFQNLINNIPDHIYIKDRKGRFILVNKAAANFLGKEPKDLIGKTDFDFFPEEKSKEYLNDDMQVMKKEKPVTDIVEKLTYSGKEFWISGSKIPWYGKNRKVMGIMAISRDITRRKQFEDDLLTREKNLFGSLMDNITESIFYKDLNSRFIRINRACAEKFGLKNPEEAIGKTDFDFFSEEHAKQAYEDEQKVIKTGKPIVDLEEKETFADKADKWASTTKIPWYDKDNKIIGTFGITKDITEKKKSEEKIKYLSFHDTLTGLYNRAYFDEELRRLDTGRQLPVTIVMGDVNGLKVINDAYGHEKGDQFLKKIATILKDAFRKDDIVSRWGGDEFIAILPRTHEKDAKGILKRIKELCQERTTTDMPLSISIGISSKKLPQEDMNTVLKEAEDKMYKNKLSESRSTNEIVISSLKENLKKAEYNGEKHGDKMQQYALAIGKRLDLSNAKLEELKLVMDLHNIGKLALADEIISKPGRLSKEEWKIIKKLPEIGYRIAESSMVLKPISEAILSHYEWYNGEGYPRGVKGEDIPILSRISFLVNSFEAMITDRPYRKKMTVKDVIKEIKRCRGTQFDPKIVKIFLEILEKNSQP